MSTPEYRCGSCRGANAPVRAKGARASVGIERQVVGVWKFWCGRGGGNVVPPQRQPTCAVVCVRVLCGEPVEPNPATVTAGMLNGNGSGKAVFVYECRGAAGWHACARVVW